MSNINEEYIEDYIRSILPENQAYLRNLEIYADNNHIPIVEKEVAQFLKLLLKIHQPKKYIRNWYCYWVFCSYNAEANEYARITTIERSSNMVELAKENINNTTYKDRINIIEGEAEEILSNLEGKYDFIFLDAAKGQYLEFLTYAWNY